jgi:hypothetical protein
VRGTLKRLSLTRVRTALGALAAAALVLIVIVGGVGWIAIQPALLPPEPSMPALSPTLSKLQDYYRFRFLPDGYPGRLDGSEVIAHPIYGTYVIADYRRQYQATPTPELRAAIIKVAHAAIARMETLEDGLVFWYPDALAVARQPGKHYSGLTQAYYAVELYRAFQVTGDTALRDASERCFRSLLIPAADGGVHYAWEDGVAIAEVPTSPRDLILNGWLSILASVHVYADLTGSDDATALFDESAATVARLLPLYDAPTLSNSRYGLTGPLSIALRIEGAIDDVRIADLRLDIPKEGPFEIPLRKGGQWEDWVDPKTATAAEGGLSPSGPEVHANVVLSRLSYPAQNSVHFSVTTPRDLRITLIADVGRYDPLQSQPVGETWHEVQTVAVAAGSTNVDIGLPWDLVDLVAYPTNFVKNLNGKNTDVYHAVHIARLRSLAEWTGNPMFTEWADRWQGYVCAWVSMPLYRGLYIGDFRLDSDEASVDPASACS